MCIPYLQVVQPVLTFGLLALDRLSFPSSVVMTELCISGILVMRSQRSSRLELDSGYPNVFNLYSSVASQAAFFVLLVRGVWIVCFVCFRKASLDKKEDRSQFGEFAGDMI